MKRTLLLLALALLFPGCQAYEASVSSRSDSLAGYAKDGAYGGRFSHTVTYR